MAETIKNASFETKRKFKLPKGAEIVRKDITINVEEIENGFIIRKSFDIKYTLDGDNQYEHYTKKWFSEENPIQIDDDVAEELSDKF